MKSIYTTRHCDRNPRHFPNQADLPLSPAAVDANRLGDKKIAYGNPQVDQCSEPQQTVRSKATPAHLLKSIMFASVAMHIICINISFDIFDDNLSQQTETNDHCSSPQHTTDHVEWYNCKPFSSNEKNIPVPIVKTFEYFLFTSLLPILITIVA